MRPSFFTILAHASFLLCVTSLVLGLWGFRKSSDVRFEWIGDHRTICLFSDRGIFAMVVADGWPDARWATVGCRTVDTPTPLTISSLLVADTTLEQRIVTDGTATGTVTYQGIRTNFLYAISITLIAPVAWLARLSRPHAASSEKSVRSASAS